MNNKILISVYVPAMEMKYDVFIPINKKVGTIKQIIIQSITEMSEIKILKNVTFELYDKLSGNAFDQNMYIKNSGIKNGSILMLL